MLLPMIAVAIAADIASPYISTYTVDDIHSQIKNIEDLYVLKFLQIERTTCYLFSNLSLDQILFFTIHCKIYSIICTMRTIIIMKPSSSLLSPWPLFPCNG